MSSAPTVKDLRRFVENYLNGNDELTEYLNSLTQAKTISDDFYYSMEQVLEYLKNNLNDDEILCDELLNLHKFFSDFHGDMNMITLFVSLHDIQADIKEKFKNNEKKTEKAKNEKSKSLLCLYNVSYYLNFS